jgi:hypothetical protein
MTPEGNPVALGARCAPDEAGSNFETGECDDIVWTAAVEGESIRSTCTAAACGAVLWGSSAAVREAGADDILWRAPAIGRRSRFFHMDAALR